MRAGGFLVIAGLAAAGALALGVPLGTIFFIGLILVCPLMMMGMHGGHGGHSEHEDHVTHGHAPAQQAQETTRTRN